MVRPTLFNYIATREEFENYASELFKLMSEDKFITRIHEIYPLKEAARAHNVSMVFLSLANVVLTEVAGPRRSENYGKIASNAVDSTTK